MTNDTIVHEWSKRNFSTAEINFLPLLSFKQQKRVVKNFVTAIRGSKGSYEFGTFSTNQYRN